jgi:kynurenine formamidase
MVGMGTEMEMERERAAGRRIELRGSRVIDLTHEMYHGMPSWPTNSRFCVEDAKLMEVDGYRLRDIHMNTHHGTHMDAPSHMLEDGDPVSAIDPRRLMGDGLVVDLTHKGDGEPITREDLREFEPEIRRGDMLFMHTGWDLLRGINRRYLFMWPYLSVDGAKYLVERGISLVATEAMSIGGWGDRTPTMGPITDTGTEVHRILLSNGILIIEEVANLEEVLAGRRYARAQFVALPMKLRDLDGAPTRVVAIVD